MYAIPRRAGSGETSVLATYFAPGSSFRDGLIDSLDDGFSTDAAAARCRLAPY